MFIKSILISSIFASFFIGAPTGYANSSLGEKFTVQIKHSRLNAAVLILITNTGESLFRCKGLHLRSVFSEPDPDLDERVEIVFFEEIELPAGGSVEHSWFYDEGLVLDFADLLGLDGCS